MCRELVELRLDFDDGDRDAAARDAGEALGIPDQ
jgi:hypothetical protein